MGWAADPSVRRWPRGRRSPWSAPTNCSCWVSAVLRRHLAACPAARITRTRSVHEQPRYSPISWQRIAFRRSAPSARSSTLASPGRSGCGTTSLQEPRVGRSARMGQRRRPRPRPRIAVCKKVTTDFPRFPGHRGCGVTRHTAAAHRGRGTATVASG